MPIASFNSLPVRSGLGHWRVIIYIIILILAVLLVWYGPGLLGITPTNDEQAPLTLTPAKPNLGSLQQDLNGWQNLWQDQRFTELQSISELVPSSGGNLTPFTKEKPTSTANPANPNFIK